MNRDIPSMKLATRSTKDGPEPVALSPHVHASLYAAAAAALAGCCACRGRPSPGGACKPSQDRLLLRLLRLQRPGVPRGSAALHARQAGLLQDAKPQERVPPGAPAFSPSPPTALLHARRPAHREVSTAAAATTARATRRSRTARRHGSPTPSSKDSPCQAAAAGRSGALSHST